MVPKPTVRPTVKTTLKDSKDYKTVDDVLANITIAEVEAPPVSLFAPTTSLFAGTVSQFAPSLFKAAASQFTPTSQFTPWTSLWPTRRDTGRPKKKLIRHHTILIPPLRTEGELLWIPVQEYVRNFEDYDDDELWLLGRRVSFDDAVESLRWQGYDDDDELEVVMMTIDEEADTWCNYGWGNCEHDAFPDAMELAQTLRQEVAGDPAQITQVLELPCLHHLADMVGATKTPMHDVVHNAIVADPNNGLGGAAIDHAVWLHPGELGHDGVQLEEMLQEIMADDYLCLDPQENFLMYTGSLLPGTDGRQAPHSRQGINIYPMYGEYVVSKVTYHSDLDGIIVGGWRSCWLEPVWPPTPIED